MNKRGLSPIFAIFDAAILGLLLLCFSSVAQAAAPTFQAAGAVSAGTGARTVAWPTHAIDDVALLIVQTANQVSTLSTPAGFAEIANFGTGTAGSTVATRLTVFWARATSTTMTSPVIADSGDNQVAQIVTFRGVIGSGNPWDVTAGNVLNPASTSFTIPGATTTVANTLVVAIVANGTDSNTAQTSGWTNAGLTGLTERADAQATAGNGGGFGVATGVKATAGTYGSTTGSLATSSVQGRMSLALKPKTTTLGDGTNPTNATIAPSGTITDLDAFTLITSTGTDSVTGLTVTLTGTNAFQGLSEVRITNSAGTTTYFSAVANPASNTITFSGGTAIPVTASSSTFKVRITPKTHANMPVPPGLSYGIGGTITAFTCTNEQLGSDSASATVTLDNLSPLGATAVSGSPASTNATLNWTSSASGDFATTNGSVVYRWAASSAGIEVPAEGSSPTLGSTNGTATLACLTSSAASTALTRIDGTGGSADCTTTALTNGQAYTYKIFQKDSNGNYDVGVPMGTFTPNITCFTDNFNRADGAPAGNWVVANESGTFGNPKIVNQRLRLTNASTSVSTMAVLQQLFPAAGNKIVVEFDHFAYNGSGADGMCVVLSDASVAPVPGAFGGSLGYAPKQVSAGGDTTHAGFAGGWLGFALDEYGNFSNPTEGRTGGPGFRQDSASIRGSGSLYTGYAYLAGTATLAPGIDNAGSTTAAPGYRYRITIDHTNGVNAYTSVERDTGTGYATLIAPFDAKAAAGQATVPTNWYLSFTGTTGAATNIHEFDNLRVCTTQPQPLPTLNHVRILHDGCAQIAVAETITLKACADASCSTLYLGPVTVNLTDIAGANWSSDPVTFSGGQTTVSLTNNAAGAVTLGGIVTAPAATNTTAVCYNGATQTCTLTFTAFATCFDAVEVTHAASTPIYTKLAGTDFSLDVLALAPDVNGPISIALVDPNAPSGNCSDSNTGLTAESTPPYSFTPGDSGRHTFKFNYSYAAKNVKVRIHNTSTDQSSCSSDNFAIRPLQFTLSTTTSLNPTTNTLKAGADFNLTADSGVTSGYTGTPTTNPAQIVDHNVPAIAIAANTLTGNFTAGTGAKAVGTFQYLDVGTITLKANSVFDATFTAVDEVTGLVGGVNHGASGDCTANSASNTPSGGFYGCNIGSSTLGPLGRFYPDHYEVTASLSAACNGFTYMGQQTLGMSLGIQALSSAGATPLSRYTSGYAFLATFKVTGNNNSTDFDPLNNRLSPALPAFTWNAGAYSGSGTYSFNRAASPDGPFDNFKLKVTLTDDDGANITRLNDTTITGVSSVLSPATKIRFGRLVIQNAYGTEVEDHKLPFLTQYFSNAAQWVTNAEDNCTTLTAANFNFANYQQQLTSAEMGNGHIDDALPLPISVLTTNSGRGNLYLTRPSGGDGNYVGSVNVCADLGPDTPSVGSPPNTAPVCVATSANMPWLQGRWSETNYDDDPTGRVNFGIYRGNDRIINWREIIR